MSDIAAGPPVRRRSFRRRLLLTIGSALGVTFVGVGLLGWVITYSWLNYNARSLLVHEAEDVAGRVVTVEGGMEVTRYPWYEPHHLFAEPRIDPYFLQVFDAQGRLLRASDNISALSETSYPDRLLDNGGWQDGLFRPLQKLRIGEQVLYYIVMPILNQQGGTSGYVQVARYEPGLTAELRRITLLMVLGLGVTLVGLLLLIRSVAERVIRPLEQITAATQSLSPDDLSRRYQVPAGADEETTQLAQTLNTLLDRLEQSFGDMKRFTSNAAHELQTPLTVLRGHVDIALRRPREPASYRQTLALLGDEIDHLVRMVRSLLTLARLDRRPEAVMEAGPVDLAEAVRAEAVAYQQAAEAKGLTFVLDLPKTAWTHGRPELLREVVANVLDNAVKYTRTGTIQVHLQPGREVVVLRVVDTGTGISSQALPFVTNRFYRDQQANGRAKGQGLGLSIVSEIIKWHQGRLDIEVVHPHGTAVTVTLPAAG